MSEYDFNDTESLDGLSDFSASDEDSLAFATGESGEETGEESGEDPFADAGDADFDVNMSDDDDGAESEIVSDNEPEEEEEVFLEEIIVPYQPRQVDSKPNDGLSEEQVSELQTAREKVKQINNVLKGGNISRIQERELKKSLATANRKIEKLLAIQRFYTMLQNVLQTREKLDARIAEKLMELYMANEPSASMAEYYMFLNDEILQRFDQLVTGIEYDARLIPEYNNLHRDIIDAINSHFVLSDDRVLIAVSELAETKRLSDNNEYQAFYGTLEELAGGGIVDIDIVERFQDIFGVSDDTQEALDAVKSAIKESRGLSKLKNRIVLYEALNSGAVVNDTVLLALPLGSVVNTAPKRVNGRVQPGKHKVFLRGGGQATGPVAIQSSGAFQYPENFAVFVPSNPVVIEALPNLEGVADQLNAGKIDARIQGRLLEAYNGGQVVDVMYLAEISDYLRRIETDFKPVPGQENNLVEIIRETEQTVQNSGSSTKDLKKLMEKLGDFIGGVSLLQRLGPSKREENSAEISEDLMVYSDDISDEASDEILQLNQQYMALMKRQEKSGGNFPPDEAELKRLNKMEIIRRRAVELQAGIAVDNNILQEILRELLASIPNIENSEEYATEIDSITTVNDYVQMKHRLGYLKNMMESHRLLVLLETSEIVVHSDVDKLVKTYESIIDMPEEYNYNGFMAPELVETAKALYRQTFNSVQAARMAELLKEIEWVYKFYIKENANADSVPTFSFVPPLSVEAFLTELSPDILEKINTLTVSEETIRTTLEEFLKRLKLNLVVSNRVSVAMTADLIEKYGVSADSIPRILLHLSMFLALIDRDMLGAVNRAPFQRVQRQVYDKYDFEPWIMAYEVYNTQQGLFKRLNKMFKAYSEYYLNRFIRRIRQNFVKTSRETQIEKGLPLFGKEVKELFRSICDSTSDMAWNQSVHGERCVAILAQLNSQEEEQSSEVSGVMGSDVSAVQDVYPFRDYLILFNKDAMEAAIDQEYFDESDSETETKTDKDLPRRQRGLPPFMRFVLENLGVYGGDLVVDNEAPASDKLVCLFCKTAVQGGRYVQTLGLDENVITVCNTKCLREIELRKQEIRRATEETAAMTMEDIKIPNENQDIDNEKHEETAAIALVDVDSSDEDEDIDFKEFEESKEESKKDWVLLPEMKILDDGTQVHMLHGVLHNALGPAVIKPDGTEEYWTRGVQYESLEAAEEDDEEDESETQLFDTNNPSVPSSRTANNDSDSSDSDSNLADLIGGISDSDSD